MMISYGDFSFEMLGLNGVLMLFYWNIMVILR